MKVLVDFPADFTSDKLLCIQLARINVGFMLNPRLMLHPDGKIKFHIHQQDIDSGAVVVEKDSDI